MAERTRANYKSTIDGIITTNGTGDISGSEVNSALTDAKDSAAWLSDFNPITAAGTDTYTCSMGATLTDYANGRFFLVKFTNANTGAATLNVDGLGAKSIKKNGATALSAGDIAVGTVKLMAYDGTNFQIVGNISSSSIGGSTGAADEALIRADGTGGATIQAASPIFATDDGRLYGTALHNNANPVTGTTNQYLASGTYTPTVGGTGSFNIGSSTADVCHWMRVGNVVTVAGKVTIDPTSSGGTMLAITLPIASNFANTRNCGGTASTAEVSPGIAAAISADSTNDVAVLGWTGTENASHIWYFSFTYLIL